MMMRWKKGLLTVLAAVGLAVVPGAASAQDDTTGVGATEAEVEEVTEGVFDSPFMVTFRGGPMGFEDSTGDYENRMSEGFNLQWDVIDTAGLDIGAETGFHYSHLGSAEAGFFGASEEGQDNAGANSFIVPLQAVVGYSLSDSFQLAAHLGGSLLYRSIGESLQIGREGDDSNDDQLDVLPSLALNAGYAIGDNTALSLRGDYIPTAADDIYIATLGLGIGL